MSGYGTKKRGGDFATQLTFPAVYSDVYAQQHLPLEYAPSYTGPLVHPMAGDDFQSHYHSQKKRDADYMATAKVIATRNARHRYVVSPHGYYNLPPTQLVQRVYANPSNGAQIISSSRRDGNVRAPFTVVESGMLEGGVLRTAEGQAYGKARLMARIGQLNNIEAAKEQFVSGISQPVAAAQRPQSIGVEGPTETIEIELNLLLQSVIDALMGTAKEAPEEGGEAAGEFLSRFTFTDAVRAVSIIFRLVPQYGREDVDKLEDIMGKVDITMNLLNGLMDPDMDNGEENDALSRERLITTFELFKRLREYLVGMMDKVDLSPKERLALSKNLVKTLGFSKFLRDMTQAKQESRELFRNAANGRLFDARGRQDFDDYDDDDDDDDDDFDAPARPREDEEHDGEDENFDEDERQVFGYESGQFFNAPRQNGRAAPQFFGSDEREVAPEEDGIVISNTATRLQNQQQQRQNRGTNVVSTNIRSVYDPILGTRGIEVLRPMGRNTEAHSYVSRSTESSRGLRKAVPSGTFRTVSSTTSESTPRNAPRRQLGDSTQQVPSLSSVSSVGVERGVRYKTKDEINSMTRDQLVDYASRLNREQNGIDGKPIRINRGSTVENIRRNFLRRIGYQGRK